MRRSVTSCCVALSVVAASAASAFADDLRVPRDYRTIDAALAVAKSGDRIIVVGGRHRGVLVATDGVELVGKNATLRDLTISGDGVTVRNFRLANGSDLVIRGADAKFIANKADGRAGIALRVQGGANALVEGNSWHTGSIIVDYGQGVVVRGNRSDNAKIRINGEGVRVEANAFQLIDIKAARAVVVDNRASFIMGNADDCVFEHNTTESLIEVTGNRTAILGNTVKETGITATGDDVTVSGNTVEQSLVGVWITGNRAKIAGNDVHVRSAHRASLRSMYCNEDDVRHNPGILIEATEPGATVEGNHVTHTDSYGISLSVDGAVVRDNVVVGVGGGTAISVTGSTNVIEGNDVSQTDPSAGSGSGISVSGDANVVQDNQVADSPVDAIVVASGTGNVVSDNVVADPLGCGVLVMDAATGTIISSCDVSGGGLGIVNAGSGTSLSDSQIDGTRFADVLDVSGFALFERNVFGTMSHDLLLLPKR